MDLKGINMQMSSKKAFTMIELVFVIVVIGILAAIAIPKMAATRDDATITKAIATVGSIRSAIATERQKRILRGDFTDIGDLALVGGNDKPIFDFFDGNNTLPVLEYSLRSCASGAKGCWIRTNATTYTYTMPVSGTVVFTLSNNRFDCPLTNDDCLLLTK